MNFTVRPFVRWGTGLWVLAAVIFNLVTELVGGVRVTVLEEEVVARPVEPASDPR